jgi:hypothetical protein
MVSEQDPHVELVPDAQAQQAVSMLVLKHFEKAKQ